MAYKINFVKYVDEQGNEDYWFRLVSEPKVRFLYYFNIQVDDTIYKLLEIKNPNHSQLHASAYLSFSARGSCGSRSATSALQYRSPPRIAGADRLP